MLQTSRIEGTVIENHNSLIESTLFRVHEKRKIKVRNEEISVRNTFFKQTCTSRETGRVIQTRGREQLLIDQASQHHAFDSRRSRTWFANIHSQCTQLRTTNKD